MIPMPVVALLWVAAFFAIAILFARLDMGRVTRAQHLIDAGSPYIDVDSHVDYLKGHPHGSVNMPCSYVVYLARNFDRRVPLVVHGHFFKAAIAAHRLRKAGFQVLSLGSARTESMN